MGEPTKLIDGLRVYSGGMAPYSVSNTGTLVYPTGSATSQTQLFWVDRDGKREPISDVGAYDNPELSPDGSQLIARKDDDDLWMFDLRRGTSSRLTRDGTHVNAVWAPDGKQVAYGSRTISGDVEFFVESTDGANPRRRLEWAPSDTVSGVLDWPQGPSILILAGTAQTSSSRSLRSLPIAESDAEPYSYDPPGGLDHAQVSPDGRWLAYTNRFRGVAIASFPEPSTVIRVAGRGTNQPRWSTDGKELFYREGVGRLVSVRVHQRGGSLSFDPPEALFDWSYRRGTFGVSVRAQYDVSPEGDRFVVAAPVDENMSQTRVVLNWFDELKRLAPTEDR